MTIDLVAELCKGAMSKRQLVKAIMDETGCGKSIAYRRIEQAKFSKRLHFTKATGTYVAR